MKAIAQAVEEYLAMRRSLGFKLRAANGLRDFAAHMRERGAAHVTIQLALAWARKRQDVQPVTLANRLSLVRQFARYLSAFDPGTQIAPPGLLRRRSARRRPYLYTSRELRKILETARRLPSNTGLRGATYCTLIGLLAVTELRQSEAAALDDRDVDLRDGVLTVRQTKFKKSRLVPLHPSSTKALRDYVRFRDSVAGARKADSLFVGEDGRRLTSYVLTKTFARIRRETGLCEVLGRQARPHDLRHRFAVATLIWWYRQGVDVEQRLPVLSTFLGHAEVRDTYWYLTGVPELLRLAMARLENEGER